MKRKKLTYLQLKFFLLECACWPFRVGGIREAPVLPGAKPQRIFLQKTGRRVSFVGGADKM